MIPKFIYIEVTRDFIAKTGISTTDIQNKILLQDKRRGFINVEHEGATHNLKYYKEEIAIIKSTNDTYVIKREMM